RLVRACRLPPCVGYYWCLRREAPSGLFPYTALFRSWQLLRPFRAGARGERPPPGRCPGSGDRRRIASPERAQEVGSCCALSGLGDRKSTRLNSSHQIISYAVFCLKTTTTQNSAAPTA